MSGVKTIPIHKMNGLGNQIVVADLRQSTATLNGSHASQIAQHPRTHFDQLMALVPSRSPGTEAFIEIFNQDGSTAGACGNGMRCVGLVMQEAGRSATYETSAGLLPVQRDQANILTVDMGEPRFRWDEIPLRDEFHDTARIELQIGPIDDPHRVRSGHNGPHRRHIDLALLGDGGHNRFQNHGAVLGGQACIGRALVGQSSSGRLRQAVFVRQAKFSTSRRPASHRIDSG